MWFIANGFERYVAGVAKTFINLAAKEAEAHRRALAVLWTPREGRQRLILPQRALKVPPAIVHPGSPEGAAALASAASGTDRAEGHGSAAAALARAMGPAGLPMGVRGEVVARYINALSGAAPHEAAELIERLRKDKKVRVAELQCIVADLLEEDLTVRRKADHLDALRRHLVPQTARSLDRAHRPVAFEAAVHAD